MRWDISPLFAALPAPWSRPLSQAYLRFTRRVFQARIDNTGARWLQTLLPAALGLSVECFSEALEPWTVGQDHGTSGRLQQSLQRFGEVIRVRRAFREEAMTLAQTGNALPVAGRLLPSSSPDKM